MRVTREGTTTDEVRAPASAPASRSIGAAATVAEPPAMVRQGGRWKAAIVAAVACVGLWLAVPRLIGSILLLPGHQALDILAQNEALTQEGEGRALESREAALPWLEDRRVRTDLAAIKLYEALKPGQTPEAAEQLVAEAKANLKAGLALAPIDPRAWLQWPNLRALQLGTAEDADTGIRMSVRSGPAEREIYIERAAFALVLWNDLSAETQDVMLDQFGEILKVSPLRFAALVHSLTLDDALRLEFMSHPETADDNVRRLDDALATLFAGS